MKKLGGVILLALGIFFLSTAIVSAQQGSGNAPDPQFEQQIYDRLGKINPDAVQVFKDASVAYYSSDLGTAKAGFLKVLDLAPGFPDALRRLSTVERFQKDNQNAETHARQAVAGDPSPDNQAALALALAEFTDQARIKEALTLAQAAQQSRTDDPYFNQVLLMAGVKNEDVSSIRLAANQLIKLQPKDGYAHYFAGIVAANDHDPERAENELLLAEQYGISKSDVEKAFTDSGVRTQAAINRSLRWGGIGLAGWLIGLVLLFAAGLILSSLTLKAVDREIATPKNEIGPSQMAIRRVYRVVIGITAGYFYFSIPILILLVVACVGGVIYLFFALGSVPLRLAFFIFAAGLVTLIAIVRSIFARVKNGDPGRKVDAKEMPELWQLSREVARKVGTRPVDAIFLTPAVEVAVTERGSLASKLSDKSERILILGMGALSNLTQGQLRAILAHEYGHFNNRDTAGGTVARQVQVSVYMMAATLAANGLAHWYNPVWLFINGYHRIFLRITLGASRLQEILADRIAALSYGIHNLTSGLKAIIRTSLEFDFKVDAEIAAARGGGRGLHNLYSLPDLPDPAPLEQKFTNAMTRPSSPYDSHPAPRERLALISRIQANGFFDEDPRPAWDLIPNASQLQEEVTAQIEEQLRRRNVLTS